MFLRSLSSTNEIVKLVELHECRLHDNFILFGFCANRMWSVEL
jgi:hypothetical protein